MRDVIETNLPAYDHAPECGLIDPADIIYEMTGKIFGIEDILWN